MSHHQLRSYGDGVTTGLSLILRLEEPGIKLKTPWVSYKASGRKWQIEYQASIKECVLENYFLYFSSKTYVVGTQKNRLNETVLLSTQNTFKLMGKKKFPYPDLWTTFKHGSMNIYTQTSVRGTSPYSSQAFTSSSVVSMA